jgi:hypothetical protein
MLVRAVAVWLFLAVLAPVNGIIRNAWITPRVGERGGHLISTLSLCVLIFAVAWASIRWIGPGRPGDASVIGLVWVVLTVAYEFLLGHFLFGNPWQKLILDYNMARGRVWVLVLIASYVAPRWAMRVRGM